MHRTFLKKCYIINHVSFIPHNLFVGRYVVHQLNIWFNKKYSYINLGLFKIFQKTIIGTANNLICNKLVGNTVKGCKKELVLLYK